MADLNSTIVRGKLRVTEDINVNGNVTGNGSGLTNLNASNIGSGTLSVDRLADSGVTATSYGPSTNATPGYSGTFNVPYITDKLQEAKRNVIAEFLQEIGINNVETALDGVKNKISDIEKFSIDVSRYFL